MQLEQVLKTVAEEQALDSLAPSWQDSMACLPAGCPDFLDAAHLREVMDYTGVDSCEHDAVFRMAATIAADAALKRLAWHCRRVLCDQTRSPIDSGRWPALVDYLGAEAGYFYFIIALATVDSVRAFHSQHGLPEEITRDTCGDVARFRPCYHGVRVTVPGTLSWLRHASVGDLFKVGRHQYIRTGFRGPLMVFRHAASGDVVALSEPGVKFDSAGFRDGDGGVFDPDAWTTHLEVDEYQADGFPISPTGRAVAQAVRLRLDEWTLVLVRDTPVLDMHIPPFEPLGLAETGDSMRRAARFFRRYLPQRAFRGFACTSWLFNTQLQEILGEQSNLVAWQHEQYLYPVPSAKPSGLQFIFGFKPFDPATAPRDTRLRRGVLERLERGEPIRCGAMFGLPEDLPHFGTQCYRDRWPSVCQRLGLPEGS